MTIDILPTVARLIGASLPQHPIDGRDIWPLLTGEPGARSPHEALFFHYGNNQLQAMRAGCWKLVFPHTYRSMLGQEPGRDGIPGQYIQCKVERPELYDLSTDIGESRDVSASHPDVVTRLCRMADRQRADLGDSLTRIEGAGKRPAGRE